MLTTYERRNMIIDLIRSRDGISGYELAKLTGVSVRTVRRDLDAISVFEPIYCEYGRKGGIHLLDEEAEHLVSAKDISEENKILQ